MQMPIARFMVTRFWFLSKWMPHDQVAPFEWVTLFNKLYCATTSSCQTRHSFGCQRLLRRNELDRVDLTPTHRNVAIALIHLMNRNQSDLCCNCVVCSQSLMTVVTSRRTLNCSRQNTERKRDVTRIRSSMPRPTFKKTLAVMKEVTIRLIIQINSQYQTM